MSFPIPWKADCEMDICKQEFFFFFLNQLLRDTKGGRIDQRKKLDFDAITTKTSPEPTCTSGVEWPLELSQIRERRLGFYNPASITHFQHFRGMNASIQRRLRNLSSTTTYTIVYSLHYLEPSFLYYFWEQLLQNSGGPLFLERGLLVA